MKTIYFSHDTNSFYDPKIRYIVGNHGCWAYAIFWIILEMMATQKDYKIKLDGFINGFLPIIQGKNTNYKSSNGIGYFEDDEKNPMSIEQSARCSICFDDLLLLLKDMIKIGLFVETDDGYFYSESLKNRMLLKDEISLKRMEAGKLGGLSRSSKQMLSKPSKCLAHKVKESKVKERKEDIALPTLEDVKNYCLERNNGVDPQRWYDFYSSKGWMIGKNKMKDWKAAVRTWEKNNFSNSSSTVKIMEGF